MNVLVIEPGHGSLWLMDATYHDEGRWVEGWTWDDSGIGSALMPDDFRGEKVVLGFPTSYILKVETPEAKDE
jgi:hypothetical protein